MRRLRLLDFDINWRKAKEKDRDQWTLPMEAMMTFEIEDRRPSLRRCYKPSPRVVAEFPEFPIYKVADDVLELQQMVAELLAVFC